MPWTGGHSARLNTSGWQRQRDNQAILERDGHRCTVALPDGTRCPRPATAVDHVTNLAITGPGGHHPDNMAAICAPHHDEKTRREAAAGRARHSLRRPTDPHPGAIT